MKFNITKTFGITILLICSISIASATDYFVSTTGNDSNNGLSIENAFFSVKHAATFTNPGDTVWIVNGTYYDEYKIKPKGSGNFTHRITFTAYNGTPIFRFSDANLGWVGDNTKLLFELWEYSYFNISNIYIDGYPGFAANIGSYTNIDNISYMNQGGPITLSNGFESAEFKGSGYNSLTNSIIGGVNETCGYNSLQLQGMYGAQNAHPSHDILVANNKIYNNTMHNLVDLFGYQYNITIRDNEIYGGSYQAVFNHGSETINQIMERVYFYNNTIHDMTGTAGAVTVAYWHDSLIYNNTFYNIPNAVSISSTTTNDQLLPDNLTIYNNIFLNASEGTTKMFMWSEGNHSINIAGQNVNHYFTGTSLYYNNNIKRYTVGGNGLVTIKDNNINNYIVDVSGNGIAEIQNTVNKVFTVSTTANLFLYINKSEVVYHPDKSNFSVQANNTANVASFVITFYPMTARPTADPATIVVNKFDTTLTQGNILVDFTANTINGNNVVFTVNELQPNHYYLIKKDGTNFTTTQANSTGYIQFSNSEWSEHTFIIEETSQPVDQEAESDTPISITLSTTQTTPGETFTLSIPINPATPITGAQFDLLFTNSLATVTSVTEGNLLNQDGATTLFNSGTINNAAGTVTDVYGSILGNTSVSSQGSLAMISMTAGSTTGYLNLDLSNVVISDANSAAVPYTLTNATVLIDTAPVLTQIGAKSVDEGSALVFTAGASDADGDSLTYSAANLPAGASFNTATGAFSWTPADGQAGTYVITFEVTDGYLSDSETVTITVNDANHAPVITTFVPANSLTFNELDVITIGIIATDADGDALSYTIKIDGVTKSTSSSYVWETDYSSAGSHTIDIIVSDGIEQVTDQRTITINDVRPRWDVNEDGTVNVLDISIIGQKYGASVGAPYPRWDVNQDGVINVQDMTLAAYHFGETVA